MYFVWWRAKSVLQIILVNVKVCSDFVIFPELFKQKSIWVHYVFYWNLNWKLKRFFVSHVQSVLKYDRYNSMNMPNILICLAIIY